MVIADNCTDATVEVARQHRVEVVETVGNTEKKAGALNQELARILPDAEPRDVVLVMDADSTIAPVFLESALARLEADPNLVAVGGLFYGEDGGRILGQYQRNEYTRYQRLVARKLGRVFVLTGTASVIRAYALRAVAESRGPLLPGPAGKVYDTQALTEDNELTLSLKTLGARMTCPPECRVTTEVMTTWRDLWRQRLRWHRGALENIGAYGVTRATALYWGQQLGLAYGVLAFQSYLVLMTVSLLAADSIRWSPFWIAIGMIFVVERLVTVWRAGWRGRVLAAPMFPELAYAVYLQACFVTSIGQILRGRKADWNYVPRPPCPDSWPRGCSPGASSCRRRSCRPTGTSPWPGGSGSTPSSSPSSASCSCCRRCTDPYTTDGSRARRALQAETARAPSPGNARRSPTSLHLRVAWWSPDAAPLPACRHLGEPFCPPASSPAPPSPRPQVRYPPPRRGSTCGPPPPPRGCAPTPSRWASPRVTPHPTAS